MTQEPGTAIPVHWRLRSRKLVVAAAVLPLLTGCADGPTASSVPSKHHVPRIDLDALTGDEMVELAHETYQSWLDDTIELRANFDRDYTQLTDWATPEFLGAVQEVYDEGMPEHLFPQGAMSILWVQPGAEPRPAENQMVAEFCFDHTTMRVFNEQGQDVTSTEIAEASKVEVLFQLSEDQTRLLVASERNSREKGGRDCALP